MNWKLATLAMAALLTITLLASYVITSDALRTASAATGANLARQKDLDRAHAAVRDTQSFLNYFRLTGPSELTVDDYLREISTLRTKHIAHYPDWAETQPKLDSTPTPQQT